MDTALHDLTDDALKTILAGRNILFFRILSTQMKKRIECIAEIILLLSSKGAACATRDFFALFQGSITVGSNHGWDAHSGWFDAIVKAIIAGVKVDTILPLSVDSPSMKALVARLSWNDHVRLASNPYDAGKKIRKLCISYADSTRRFECSRPDLASLCTIAEHVEVGLRLSYHRLGGLASTAALLDSTITRSSLKELAIRLMNTPARSGDLYRIPIIAQALPSALSHSFHV
jgi:hypothetical protein